MPKSANLEIEHTGDGGLALAISGVLTIATVGLLDRRLRALAGRVMRVDIAAVTSIDTSGAWVLWRMVRDDGAELIGAQEEMTRLIAAVSRAPETSLIVPMAQPLMVEVAQSVGVSVVMLGQGCLRGLSFVGAVLEGLWQTVKNPRRLRLTACSRQMQSVGIDSLIIIGLMSFLIGIVVAQQGAVQLAQFGAQIYTIDLAGRLAMRELGILMTAIMIAGRSGSAFAAQIGTMKLTEEIDAMRTIGVSPMDALIIPRVLASVIMMPLLGFYASVVAIIGAATISVIVLGIPFWTFLERIQEVVQLHDVWIGIIKAPVFGLIVALTGCYEGFQVSGNSNQVGLRTTRAVVHAIFMVIVIDAFFAVFFSAIDWR